MEGGQVIHSWCIGVVNHGYGVLDGAGMEVVNGMHAGLSQWCWSHVGRFRSTSRVRGDTLMKPGHTAVQVCCSLGRIEPELVGFPGKALSLDVTRMLRFAACSLLAAIHGAPRTLLVCTCRHI